MKYAVIADIHGNLPTLNLVLEDAGKNKVDRYIFCGDYCLSNPFPDECITRIRGIEPKLVIRGNEEMYLKNLMGKDQTDWTDGQMQISYFCYRSVSPDNLEYLLNCPEEIDLECNGVSVHIAHSSEKFLADSERSGWHPSKVVRRYPKGFISKETFQRDIRNDFDKNEVFQERFNALSEGVYIFGHSHIQWSYQSKDGKKFLIEPGSCGIPLECICNSVPYTILDISEQGEVKIWERRLAFDMEKYAETFPATAQYAAAAVWSKVMMRELREARDYIDSFLRFAEEYANRKGDRQRPFSLPTWEEAYEEWEETVRTDDGI